GNPGAGHLFVQIAGVFGRVISLTADWMESRPSVRGAVAADGSASLIAGVGDDRPDQEVTAIWRSEQRRLLAHLDRVDPALRAMAELMLVQDVQETTDLSRALAVPPAEVANRRKRLKRAVRAYLTEYVS